MTPLYFDYTIVLVSFDTFCQTAEFLNREICRMVLICIIVS